MRLSIAALFLFSFVQSISAQTLGTAKPNHLPVPTVETTEEEELSLPRAPGHMAALYAVESIGQTAMAQALSLDSAYLFEHHVPPEELVSDANRRLDQKHWAFPLMYSFGRAVMVDGLTVMSDEQDPHALEHTEGVLVPRVNFSEIGANFQLRF